MWVCWWPSYTAVWVHIIERISPSYPVAPLLSALFHWQCYLLTSAMLPCVFAPSQRDESRWERDYLLERVIELQLKSEMRANRANKQIFMVRYIVAIDITSPYPLSHADSTGHAMSAMHTHRHIEYLQAHMSNNHFSALTNGVCCHSKHGTVLFVFRCSVSTDTISRSRKRRWSKRTGTSSKTLSKTHCTLTRKRRSWKRD